MLKKVLLIIKINLITHDFFLFNNCKNHFKKNRVQTIGWIPHQKVTLSIEANINPKDSRKKNQKS